MVKVTFLPIGEAAEVPSGSTIFQAAIIAGVQLESTCGGRGTCGKCKVQIAPEKGGNNSSANTVLACKHQVFENVTVILSEQKDAHQRKSDLKALKKIKLTPSIKKYLVKLNKPSVIDQTPDWDRLISALPTDELRFSRRLAAKLAKTLHDANFQVTAVVDGNALLAVEEGDTLERSYGLAIDIGTTTVVVYMMDLNQGTVIANGAMTNPQRIFGADVISRINYASSLDRVQELQKNLIEGINNIIAQLSFETGVRTQEIYQAVVVGNTTMSHLFLGIDPTYLAPAPFIPVFRQSVQLEAHELGMNILETGTVVVLPNVAGYVGADTVGVMLAMDVDRLPGITLAIDIGTNGEMILAGQNRILTCSTAAGPAFEGAEIQFGMRAADGAIEGVAITDDVKLTVIGGGKPRGICGSGLIDVISEMVRSGVVNLAGRMAGKPEQLDKLPPAIRERLRRTEQGMEFVLVWGSETEMGEDIILSQKDVRELQLAKGAIRAGIQILLSEMGLSFEQIDRILLAGAFGNYIKKESALGIGLLPPVPLESIDAIGNAAGDGAKMALLSSIERARASELAQKAEHIELSTRKEFQDQFIKALYF